MPVVPPDSPCIARNVRVAKNHSCNRLPACPNGASTLCPIPVPKPSSETEKLCTRTCDMATSHSCVVGPCRVDPRNPGNSSVAARRDCRHGRGSGGNHNRGGNVGEGAHML